MMQNQNKADLSDFRIFETNEFTKHLKKLSKQETVFVQNKLKNYVYPQLKTEPFRGKNIKKLLGYTPNTWRYRIGKFRIFYIVDNKEKIISILTIDNRKDIYKK